MTFLVGFISAQEVTYIEPAQNAINISRYPVISFEFSEYLDLETLNDSTIVVIGSQSGIHPSGELIVDYGDYLPTTSVLIVPSGPFHGGEIVTTNLTADIRTSWDGFPIEPYSWQFTIEAPGGVSSFGDVQSMGVEIDPRGIAVADLDGDSDIDLAVANRSSSTVSILKNNGGGSFEQTFVSAVSSGPEAIVAGDLDNDGDVDLAVVCKNDNKVEILLNDGNGEFVGPYYNVGDDPKDAVVCDWDRDGDLDLAVTSGSDDDVTILFNDGNAFFSEVMDVSVQYSSAGIISGDFDNDGIIDIVVANYQTNTIAYLKNGGTGSFEEPLFSNTGLYPLSITANDWDGDGNLDIATGDIEDGTVSFLLNNGLGEFTAVDIKSLSWEFTPYSIASGDWENDGDADLVVVGFSDISEYFVLTNDGLGTFEVQLGENGLGSEIMAVVAADLDGDYDLDLAISDAGENAILALRNFSIIPTPPQDLAATSSSFRVVLSWSPNPESDISSYRVYRGIYPNPVFLQIGSNESTFYIDDTVSNDTTYIYAITAVSTSSGEGNMSDWVTITPGIVGGAMFTLVMEGDIVSDTDFSLGSTWADVDNDGDEDAFITNGAWNGYEANDLYFNNGDGTFTQVIEGSIVIDQHQSHEATWGDPDNDGDLDLYVVNGYDENNNFYENLGDGTFNQWMTGSIVNDAGDGKGAAWADVNNDGNLDLLVTNDYDETNVLYLGVGDLTFSEGVLDTETGRSHNPSFADFDNDGDVDLFIANGYYENNFLYENVGDGSFSLMTSSPISTDGGESRGGSWGDYDNDGDLDLFVSNASYTDNFLYRNEGEGTFIRITEGEIVNDGGTSNGAAWGDYDNDGDLDLYVSNAEFQNNFLYDNNGDGTFTKDTSTTLTFSNSMSKGGSWADIDNDGDLDLLVACSHNEPNELYINEGNDNHWLKVKCIGNSSNTAAIGTKVRVKATVGEYAIAVWQMREISSGTGRLSQNSLIAHFGLGTALMVDSLVIEWPSGLVEILVNIPADQMMTLTEGESTVTATFSEYSDIIWESGDDESFSGAWGDYDNDGDLDLIVSRLNGEALLYENYDGVFMVTYTFPSISHTAIWGDYNNNDTLELYLGGNGHQSLWQLQVEDDWIHFVDITDEVGLGETSDNISAACWVDFDSDGDIDLLTVDMNNNPPRLWRNDDSVFVDKAGDMGITGTGPSRAAAWSDFDSDGDQDLYLCRGASWTNLRDLLYRNDGGTFTEVGEEWGITAEEYSTGAAWGDYNRYGAMDLCVTTASGQPNHLYMNQFSSFLDVQGTPISTSEGDCFSPIWFDFDNDSDLDLFITRTSGYSNLLIQNEYDWGNMSFSDISLAAGFGDNLGRCLGAAAADFDNDGFVDLFVPNRSGEDKLYHNSGNDNNWLALRLQGTESNRNAIGTSVLRLINFEELQMFEVSGGSGSGSQNSIDIEMGLGSLEMVPDLIVIWPNSESQYFFNIDVNQILTITEPSSQYSALIYQVYSPDNTESTGPFIFFFRIWEEFIGSNYQTGHLHYGIEEPADSVTLIEAGYDDSLAYLAIVPELEGVTGTSELSYYLSADFYDGIRSFWPEGAPDTTASIVFGPDTTPPQLDSVNTLKDVHHLLPFEKTIKALATDDRFPVIVTAKWRIGSGPPILSTPMFRQDSTDFYVGTISGMVGINPNPVEYWVVAQDSTLAGNSVVSSHQTFYAYNYEYLANWDSTYWDNWELAGEVIDGNPLPEWGSYFHFVSLSDTGSSFCYYNRRLDLTHFDEVWITVPMYYNLDSLANWGYFEVSTGDTFWTVVDSFTGSYGPANVDLSLIPFVDEDSVYLRFRNDRMSEGSNDWYLDEIVLHNDSTHLELQNEPSLPDKLVLYQNYPNPFNPLTKIRFDLPERADVTLTIYDILGREVRKWQWQRQVAGYYSVMWDGINEVGEEVSAGVFLYQIRTRDFVKTKKMVLLK
ncbi:MAG: FG-GAP-like repeat-containing protein [Fidelibacterota bacterium]